MEKLIQALNIFLKYKNDEFPTHCEHDVLYVVGITQDEVDPVDVAQLNELGFEWNAEHDSWVSFRYGSA